MILSHITKGILFTSLLAVAITTSAQEEQPDFTYEISSHIGDKTGYFSAEIDPIVVGIKGSHIGLGAGVGIRFSNIKEKYTIDAHYDFMYGKFSIDKNQVGYASFDHTTKKATTLDASFGYTIKQTEGVKDVTVRLRKSGNTEFVSNLPCRVITSYIGRVGYYSTSFFSKGDLSNENYALQSPFSTYLIFQKSHNISVGLVRKTSINTSFKTDKFGTVVESTDSEIYGDILVNVSNPFPQVKEQYYLDATNPKEVSDEATASYQDQNLLRESFFLLPVGLRVGWRGNSLKKSGVIAKVELGIYPGSYSSIMKAVALRMGISYRFQHNF